MQPDNTVSTFAVSVSIGTNIEQVYTWTGVHKSFYFQNTSPKERKKYKNMWYPPRKGLDEKLIICKYLFTETVKLAIYSATTQ